MRGGEMAGKGTAFDVKVIADGVCVVIVGDGGKMKSVWVGFAEGKFTLLLVDSTLTEVDEVE